MALSNLDRRTFLRGAGASALLTATFEPTMAKVPSVLMRSALKTLTLTRHTTELAQTASNGTHRWLRTMGSRSEWGSPTWISEQRRV